MRVIILRFDTLAIKYNSEDVPDICSIRETLEEDELLMSIPGNRKWYGEWIGQKLYRE